MFYQTKHVIHTASPAQSFMTVLPSAVLVKWYQHPAVLCPIVLFSVSRFLNFVGKKSENYFIICAYLNEDISIRRLLKGEKVGLSKYKPNSVLVHGKKVRLMIWQNSN